MKNTILSNIKLFLLTTLLIITSCQINQESKDKKVKTYNNFRQDFWLKSEYALGKEFLIKVLLPSNYYDSNKKYPVLYLTDADFYFGFASDMAYHMELNSQEFILVGIGYGSKEKGWVKRGYDLHGDNFNKENVPGYALFQSFFKEELFPYIESKYRAERTNRTFFGWSSGFSFACHTLYEQRLLFDNYIIGGGRRFPKDWAEELRLNERANLRQEKTDRPISIYVGHPEFDGPKDEFINSIQSLEEQNFADLFIKWEIFEGKDHEIPAVADLIINGLEYTFNKKSIIPYMVKSIDNKNINEVILDYERWKSIRPELCDYNPGELTKVSTNLEERQKFQEQSVLLGYIAKEFPKREVIFNVTTEILSASSIVFITGNHEEIAMWDPSEIALKQHSDKTWSKTISVEEGTCLEYKFTLGSWETEALSSEGNNLPNYTHIVKSDTVINIVINNWKRFNN